MIAVSSCGGGTPAVDVESASASRRAPVSDDESPGGAASHDSGPSVALSLREIPVEVGAGSELIGVSADGIIAIRRSRSICLYDLTGVERSCQSFDDTPLRMTSGAYRPSWDDSGTQVAFSFDGGSVMIIETTTGDVSWFGGSRDAPRAHQPFWTSSGWGWLESNDGDEEARLVVDGVPTALPPFDFVDRQTIGFVAVDDSLLLYNELGGDIIRVNGYMSESITSDVFDRVDGVVSVVAHAPGDRAVLIGSLPEAAGSGVRWKLVTGTDAIELPFNGATASAATDGTAAIGLDRNAPATIVRFDVDTETTVALATLERPVDELFWSSSGRVIARTGRSIHVSDP